VQNLEIKDTRSKNTRHSSCRVKALHDTLISPPPHVLKLEYQAPPALCPATYIIYVHRVQSDVQCGEHPLIGNLEGTCANQGLM
jgi:hypothetical protein